MDMTSETSILRVKQGTSILRGTRKKYYSVLIELTPADWALF